MNSSWLGFAVRENSEAVFIIFIKLLRYKTMYRAILILASFIIGPHLYQAIAIVLVCLIGMKLKEITMRYVYL